jgi:hypothetical protein
MFRWRRSLAGNPCALLSECVPFGLQIHVTFSTSWGHSHDRWEDFSLQTFLQLYKEKLWEVKRKKNARV